MLYLSNLERNSFRIAGALKLHFFGFSVLTSLSVAQLAECSHGKREALSSSPGRATIFSSPVTFGGQGGFSARATSIKKCMFRCSSVVPSRIGDESN